MVQIFIKARKFIDIFKLPMNLIDIYLLQSIKNKTTTFTNCYPDNVVISNIRPYAITQEERLFTRPQQVSLNRLKNGFYAKKPPLFKPGVSNYTPFPFPKLTDRLTTVRGETSSSARSKSKPTGFTFLKKCRFPTVSSRIYLRGLEPLPNLNCPLSSKLVFEEKKVTLYNAAGNETRFRNYMPKSPGVGFEKQIWQKCVPFG